MPNGKTQNYDLNQWVKTDQVLMEDFNADNVKIDAALTALAGTVDAQGSSMENQAATLAKLGNCEVYHTSYVGTGKGACSHTFPHYPLFALILRSDGGGRAELVRGVAANSNSALSSGDTFLDVTWSGNTLKWTASTARVQLNEEGKRYYLLALLDASR